MTKPTPYEQALRASVSAFKIRQESIAARKTKLHCIIPNDSVRYTISCIMIDNGYDIDLTNTEHERQKLVEHFWKERGIA
jgi:hypothetical protein